MASIYLGSLALRQPAGFQQIQNHSANLIDLLTFFIHLDDMHFNPKWRQLYFFSQKTYVVPILIRIRILCMHEEYISNLYSEIQIMDTLTPKYQPRLHVHV